MEVEELEGMSNEELASFIAWLTNCRRKLSLKMWQV